MWNVRKLSPANKSGKRGVSWDAHCNKWLVRITANGKLFELGIFPREELSKAIEVRRAAELKHYGKYAPKESALTVKSEAEIAALSDGRGAPKLDRRNKSGKQGVSWQTRTNRWESTLHFNGKQVYLGSFPVDRLDAAIEARRAGELKYWGKLCPK
jgi:hypothetical protein